MTHIALVTCARFPKLQRDFQHSIGAFQDEGAETSIVVWDDDQVDWSSFDGAVIQSTWDYFENHSKFLAWTERVQTKTRLINNAEVVRWNSDKRYLIDLEADDVSIVPTEIVDDPKNFEQTQIDAETFITKPTVSANSIETYVVDRKDLRTKVRSYETPLLIQPFREEISEGEVSVMYFDYVRSHAVRKTPKPGDFRVQDGWGGTVARCTDVDFGPFDKIALEIGKRWDLAYMRIDGVIVDDRVEVMELELIEPELFFRFEPSATRRYCDAILNRVSR